MLQTFPITVDVPEGYEATGEYRHLQLGEPGLTTSGTVFVACDNDQCARRMNRIVLRKLWALPVWFRPGWNLYYHYVLGWRVQYGTAVDVPAKNLWALHGDDFVTPPSTVRMYSRCE